jgi:hypothetical protein
LPETEVCGASSARCVPDIVKPGSPLLINRDIEK